MSRSGSLMHTHLPPAEIKAEVTAAIEKAFAPVPAVELRE